MKRLPLPNLAGFGLMIKAGPSRIKLCRVPPPPPPPPTRDLKVASDSVSLLKFKNTCKNKPWMFNYLATRYFANFNSFFIACFTV